MTRAHWRTTAFWRSCVTTKSNGREPSALCVKFQFEGSARASCVQRIDSDHTTVRSDHLKYGNDLIAVEVPMRDTQLRIR